MFVGCLGTFKGAFKGAQIKSYCERQRSNSEGKEMFTGLPRYARSDKCAALRSAPAQPPLGAGRSNSGNSAPITGSPRCLLAQTSRDDKKKKCHCESSSFRGWAKQSRDRSNSPGTATLASLTIAEAL
ncbi:hypothetical protein D6821_01540 [Candidatus Parcubacteria bacterium]|nr:MAG: hypothetical protein D6821_01540 [Candidatus Parcubacteria bacterium]